MTVICLTGCSGGGFKTSTALKAAKAYGIKEIRQEQYVKRTGGFSYDPSNPTEVSYYYSPAYYYTQDGNEADYAFNQTTDSNISGLSEFFDCDWGYDKGGFELIIANDEKTAKTVYDFYAEWCVTDEEDLVVDGDKNGYTYRLTYTASREEPGKAWYYGIYLKGKTLLLIGSEVDAKHGIDDMEYFCKKFGVISPSTVKN